MEGSAHRGAVSRPPPGRRVGRFVVAAARPEDDPAIRALLRRQPMDGAIRLSFEREPSARLAAAVEGERHFTAVARERETGRVVGLGSRAVRSVWLDGEPAKLGYLAQLRAPGLASCRRLVAAGYDACEASRRSDELPYDLTSIVADNVRARRLLERGLPGLPAYRRLCRYVTLTIPTVPRNGPTRVRRGSVALLPAVVACLGRNLRRYQLAPLWTEDDFRSAARTRGLEAGDFLVAGGPGHVAGCVAVWDQRGFKQVVVRGYAPPLGRLRLLVNAYMRLVGLPRLPPPGRPLALAHLSHLAVDDDRQEVAVELIRAARRAAARRGLDYLVLGLAEANPMLPALRRAFPARELVTLLYLTHRCDGTRLDGLASRCPHLEAAVL